MRESPSLDSPNTPGVIFNGMIHPLKPYAIRGVIWYQGESHNQNQAHLYGKQLEMLVTGIRSEWGDADLPFYFCQLANLGKPEEEPLEEKNNWLMVSDQIRLAADHIPHTGMVVLNDVGQPEDIHPRNKVDVGLQHMHCLRVPKHMAVHMLRECCIFFMKCLCIFFDDIGNTITVNLTMITVSDQQICSNSV